MVSGAVPVFESVTTCTALGVFSGELNVRVVGDATSAGDSPVPLSATVAEGTATSDELTISDALRAPIAVGANRTLTVQLRPDAKAVPHRLFMVKSAGFVPPSVMPLIVSATGPMLLSVTVHDELCVPTV